jgi:hypothetical protein
VAGGRLAPLRSCVETALGVQAAEDEPVGARDDEVAAAAGAVELAVAEPREVAGGLIESLLQEWRPSGGGRGRSCHWILPPLVLGQSSSKSSQPPLLELGVLVLRWTWLVRRR